MTDALARMGLVGESRYDVEVGVEYSLSSGLAAIPADIVAVWSVALGE